MRLVHMRKHRYPINAAEQISEIPHHHYDSTEQQQTSVGIDADKWDSPLCSQWAHKNGVAAMEKQYAVVLLLLLSELQKEVSVQLCATP